MSIKNQLRAAILSGGSMAAMPAPGVASAINLKLENNKTNHFVAPYNGYITVAAGTDARARIRISSSSCETSAGRIDGANAAATSLPISKGSGYDVELINAETVFFARFVKLVGGGGKNPVAQLIRRVVLCLRSTFDQCLSRTVDRIRAFLSTGGLLFSIKLSRQVRLIMSLLRQTASWLCSARVQFLLQRTVDTTLAHARREGRGQQLTFPLKKVKQSRSYITILRADQGRYESICTRTLARNLALGGASHA